MEPSDIRKSADWERFYSVTKVFLQQDRHVAEGFLSPAGDPDWNEIRQYVTYVTPGWGISMDKTVFEETCNRSKTQLAFIV